MPEEERRRRMTALRARVLSRSVQDWAAGFVDSLVKNGHENPYDLAGRPVELMKVAKQIAACEELSLLLDYDGTLVPLVRRPEQASPDPALVELLVRLSKLHRLHLHVASGRVRDDLERWFGGLPISLHAEHGLWTREPGREWRPNVNVEAGWKAQVRPILEEFALRTPGAHIEEKSAGLAWHYREADPQLGPLQVKELRLHLGILLAQQPVTVIKGHKVLEVRLSGVTKANAVRIAADRAPNSKLVAFGDDKTDEDLFTALPGGSWSFGVGTLASKAGYRLGSSHEARLLLEEIIRSRT